MIGAGRPGLAALVLTSIFGCSGPAPTLTPTQSPSPTTSARATPAPDPTMATGEWTGLRWTHTQTTEDVWTTDPYEGWQVFGWDGGYVAFHGVRRGTGDDWVLAEVQTKHSVDGRLWLPGQTFAVPSIDGSEGRGEVGGVVVGPAGILAYDYHNCVCACVVPRVVPLAVSQDGVLWQTVKGNVVGNSLDAGPSGYVLTEGTSFATSQDGVSWTRTRVKGLPSIRVDRLETGTLFPGGLVFTSKAFDGWTKGGMCISYPITAAPALWFSPDRKTWTRQALPGSTSDNSTFDPSLSVCRLGDLLLAQQYGGSEWSSWSSSDGQTWTPLATDYLCGDTSLIFGRHVLRMSFDEWGTFSLDVLGSDLRYKRILHSGDVPDWEAVWKDDSGAANSAAQVALGPAGLILSDGRGDLWIGLPTGPAPAD